jgi:hypothetical protein
MKKSKITGKGIIRTAIASVLSITFFSALWVGANSLAFAAASGKTESIPALAAPVYTAAEKAAPEGYQKPSVTVYESLYESQPAQKRSVHTLSPEEAAEIGALYIWEMFGESIDGKMVEMVYTSYPSSTRTYWHGAVADSMAELINAEALFRFDLDAVSGERIGIDQDLSKRFDYMQNDPTITGDDIHSLRERMIKVYEAGLLPKSPENLDEYAQIAKAYAQKHFNRSTIVSVEFESASPSLFGLYINEDGGPSIKYQTVVFNITDDTGREAKTAVVTDIHQLFYLSTQDNDIVPGFNADLPGGIG